MAKNSSQFVRRAPRNTTRIIENSAVFRRVRRPSNFWRRSTYGKSSFRDAPLGAGPQSITTNRGYGLRAHHGASHRAARSANPVAIPRNDGEKNALFGSIQTTRRANHQNPVQPPLQKYFRSHRTQITFMSPPVRSFREGRWPSSRTLGPDAVDAAALLTNSAHADGEVVWS